MIAHQKFYITLVFALIVSGLSIYSQAAEREPQNISQFVSEGNVKLDLRYRYEYVDENSPNKDANASTLRSRLSFQTGTVWGFTGLLEFDDITAIGNDSYNSTENGKTRYSIVPDPEGTETNQAWLKYDWQELSITYGRQRILHGSERFVGGVGWRQNEQTYDGFRVQWGAADSVLLDYAYIYNINRIFGPDDSVAQPADWHGENHFFRASWQWLKGHTLAAFYYGLDIDNRSDWSPNLSLNNSSDTFGVEYVGSFGPVAAKASWARQSDAADSTLNYDANYYLLEAAMNITSVKTTVGYEVLSSDNDVGFKTPLATLHKFQGWADMFSTTPKDGIKDLYVSASSKAGPIQLAAIYHDFKAESSSENFGKEWDLVASWVFSDHFSSELKYAHFSSDSDSYNDMKKVWLSLQLKF